MKFKIILLLLLIFLTGCHSSDSISDTLFVNTVGIDYNKETKEYHVYYHMTNPNTLTTAALGGSSQENTFSIAQAKGETIFIAMQAIASNSNKKIKLTHVQTYLFTLDFINFDNLKSFHEFIKTSPYLYSDFRILATDSKLSDILQISDIEEESPYYSLIVSSNDAEEIYKMTSIISFSRGITEKNYGINLPLIRHTTDIWSSQDNEIYSLSIVGSVFINQNDNILLLEEKDYPIIFLIKTKKNATVTIKNYQYFMTKHNYKVKHIKDNNFLIKINVVAYLTKFGDNLENPKNLFIKEMETSLSNIINKSKENNIDIFSIKEILYRKNQLKSDFDIKDANYQYEFNVKLISTIEDKQ